jgi:hypothetical protein
MRQRPDLGRWWSSASVCARSYRHPVMTKAGDQRAGSGVHRCGEF